MRLWTALDDLRVERDRLRDELHRSVALCVRLQRQIDERDELEVDRRVKYDELARSHLRG